MEPRSSTANNSVSATRTAIETLGYSAWSTRPPISAAHSSAVGSQYPSTTGLGVVAPSSLLALSPHLRVSGRHLRIAGGIYLLLASSLALVLDLSLLLSLSTLPNVALHRSEALWSCALIRLLPILYRSAQPIDLLTLLPGNGKCGRRLVSWWDTPPI